MNSSQSSGAVRPADHSHASTPQKMRFGAILLKCVLGALLGALIGLLVKEALSSVTHLANVISYGIIALFIGLFLGIGQGIYSRSSGKVLTYALVGAGVLLIIGILNGYFYGDIFNAISKSIPGLSQKDLIISESVARSIVGIGAGLAVGLMAPSGKRVILCVLGGFLGSLLGGVVFILLFSQKEYPGIFTAFFVSTLVISLFMGIGIGVFEWLSRPRISKKANK